MIIETERLILRPWNQDDAEDLYEYAKDPAVGPATGWLPHTGVEESREVIRTILSAPETYAVCLKEDGRAIGNICLMVGSGSNVEIADTEGEIGYWLGVPFWGRGLIPEAVRAMIRYAFADLHLTALWCGRFDGNEKSRRVQEKCGFTYHHTNRDILWKITGQILTEHVARLTREEWLRSFESRKLSDTEIPTALNLCRKVFSRYEAPVYPPEGTEEFLKCLQDENYLSGIEYFGTFDAHTLIGVIGIRKGSGHLCFFFVDGGYHRLGVGTKLFRLVCDQYAGRTITLNSSPYGVPFYKTLGFIPTDEEQSVNGIRFTPMILKNEQPLNVIVKLSERRDLKEKAAAWFSDKWGIPKEAYEESIEESFTGDVPSWYLYLEDERIIAGMGVIENDFHDRPDLRPNVCAVYTEPDHRSRGIAGKLLNHVCEDMASKGIDTLYLLTDHTGFYERYGWEFFCMVRGDGEETPSRMYQHKINT